MLLLKFLLLFSSSKVKNSLHFRKWNFLTLRFKKPYLFSKKDFLIFQEIELLKKLLIFQEIELLKKLLIFQEGTSELEK